MTLATSASLRQVFDEFERIKNSIRIIERSELARDVGQYSLGDLGVYPQIGYANSGSVVRVPLSMLQKVEKDLIAENIKEGINIFGLTGTLPVFTKKYKQKAYVSMSDSDNYCYEDIDGFTLRKIDGMSYINSDMDRNGTTYIIGSKNFYSGGNHYNYMCLINPATFKVTKEVEFSGSSNSPKTNCFCVFNGTTIKYYRIYGGGYWYLQELDIASLSVIKTTKLESNSWDVFGGWDENTQKGRIFTRGGNRFRELDPETLAIIRETENAKDYTSCDAFFDHNQNKYRIFATKTGKVSIDEINPDTLAVVASNVRPIFTGSGFSMSETESLLFRDKEYVFLY
nr:MAG TPA: hypothetical protein [Caudoviricetes sp.]